MEAETKTEPVFLADKNRIVALKVLCGAPGAALPDTYKPFEVLEPGMTEGASEKHLPLVETDGLRVTVRVGEIFHPMGEDYSIGWVYPTTKAGCTMYVCLDSNCEPVAHFTLEQGDSPVAAYVYCSLHGLWKTNI